MIECDISKKTSGRAQKLADQRSELGAEEAALPVHEAERSDVVGANVLQVVELQLQLAYSHVLAGELLLQPPQLILLPEEHPQELREEKTQTRACEKKLHFNIYKYEKLVVTTGSPTV